MYSGVKNVKTDIYWMGMATKVDEILNNLNLNESFGLVCGNRI